MALAGLGPHLDGVAVLLRADPRAVEREARREDEEGPAGHPALAVDGVDADGRVAAGDDLLLAVGLRREPRVEGLGVLLHRLAHKPLVGLAQHLFLLCFFFLFWLLFVCLVSLRQEKRGAKS